MRLLLRSRPLSRHARATPKYLSMHQRDRGTSVGETLKLTKIVELSQQRFDKALATLSY